MLALESFDECVAAYFEHLLIKIVLLFTSEREKEKKIHLKMPHPSWHLQTYLCIEKHYSILKNHMLTIENKFSL